ncbi:hypothetical protein K438DRAFT_1833137 [Mycena galopus ATCC 62051]|nr:hypothetical protein K438DRAFT_1833137 [Mycena galopus ATCC 62051]
MLTYPLVQEAPKIPVLPTASSTIIPSQHKLMCPLPQTRAPPRKLDAPAHTCIPTPSPAQVDALRLLHPCEATWLR